MTDAIAVIAVIAAFIYLALRLRKKSDCGSDCGTSCAAKDIKKSAPDNPPKH